jgi:hypothetical protein
VSLCNFVGFGVPLTHHMGLRWTLSVRPSAPLIRVALPATQRCGKYQVDETLVSILHRTHDLEQELRAELARRREGFGFRVRDGQVQFDAATRVRHLGLRTSLYRYVLRARPLLILSMPFIYLVAVPLVLLDTVLSLYQAVCFPVYGIPKVRRRDYFAFDRGRLVYLNAIEKVHCAYCSYANGLLAYAREIVGRTEQYWCPIKHSRHVEAAHGRYPRFVEYGNGDSYHRELDALRKELQNERGSPG